MVSLDGRALPAQGVSSAVADVAAAASTTVATARSSLVLGTGAYDGCAAVLGGYTLLYYVLMWFAATVPDDATDGHRTWATRCFMNTGEQAPAFLSAFAAHALFASPAY